ncbi:MAG: folylpolyglutamate synthase/dihydrofolate synthase family protein [Eubacteriales bacterium]
MTYDEAIEFIKSTNRFGSKPGLENISKLCELLGNPQDTYNCIHVAGTNGKGSTCSMIASILRTAGYKTGLFVSPYLDSYADSIKINGKTASEGLFADAVSLVKDKLESMPQGLLNATEFEILTAAAFLLFSKAGCDIVVLEVGLGGRLDATNVIRNPLACVITSISLDHTDVLGDTIKKIAYEKCGIIKPDGITISYPLQNEEAFRVIKETALLKNNLFVVPDKKLTFKKAADLDGAQIVYDDINLYIPLIGKHQIYNAMTAVETILTLREHRDMKVKDEDIVYGIKNTSLPARQEVLFKKPYILLDGAHNPDGVRTLAATIKTSLKGRCIAVVMGMLEDKDFETSVSMIAPLCNMFIAVEPESGRALKNTDLARVAAKYLNNIAKSDDYMEAIKIAYEYCGKGGAIVVCGSLYMAGKMEKTIHQFITDFT